MAIVSLPDHHHENLLSAARKLLTALANADPESLIRAELALEYVSAVLAVFNCTVRAETGFARRLLELDILRTAGPSKTAPAGRPKGSVRDLIVPHDDARHLRDVAPDELLRLFFLGATFLATPEYLPKRLDCARAFFAAALELVAERSRGEEAWQGLARLQSAALTPGEGVLFPLGYASHLYLACNLIKFARWALDGCGVVTADNVRILVRSWQDFVTAAPLLSTGDACLRLCGAARRSASVVERALDSTGATDLAWRGTFAGAVEQVLHVLDLVDPLRIGRSAQNIALASWGLLAWIAESAAGDFPSLAAKVARLRQEAGALAATSSELEAARRSRRAAYIDAVVSLQQLAASADAPEPLRKKARA